jgi:hypothetical protein
VRIARRQLGPGVANADYRPPIKQVIRQALVLHPTPMNEAIPISQAKPCRTTEFHEASLLIKLAFWFAITAFK